MLASVPFPFPEKRCERNCHRGVPPAAAWPREREADAGNERAFFLRQLPRKNCKLREGKKRLSGGSVVEKEYGFQLSSSSEETASAEPPLLPRGIGIEVGQESVPQMASTVTEHGNVRIITQTVPQTGSVPTPSATVRVVDSASGASQFVLTHNKKIKNTLLNVIGIMQIAFGVTHVSFGIALTAAQKSFSITVQSGTYFWIGILLLITGSLLVEVEKRQSVQLVKSAFFANLIFCVAGLIAIVLHGIEIAQTVKEGNPCDSNPSHYCRNYHQIILYGLNSVFIIFVLLEVFLAVMAVFRLKNQKQQTYQPMTS
ncbi:hypothetical protein Chor_016240 [Crotalus horridus]